MILLHHQESELSRNLLAALPVGATAVDCTDGIPADYTGPMSISAFPSVVVDVPAYSYKIPVYDSGGGLTGTATQTVAAHQEALRMPKSWDAVDEYMAYAVWRSSVHV